MKVHHKRTHGVSIAGEKTTCDNCGDKFRFDPNDSDGKYCSHDCYSSDKGPRITEDELIEAIVDLYDELGRVPYKQDMAERGEYSGNIYNERFDGDWSEAVRKAGFEPKRDRVGLVTVACDWCGEDMERRNCDVKQNRRNFCSDDCFGQWRSENVSGEDHHQYKQVTVECAQCGQETEKKPVYVEDRDNLFCSHACYGEWRSEHITAEDHPRFKGGGEFYYGENWQAQRRRRLEEDGHECQDCCLTHAESLDKYGSGLQVHHRKPVRQWYDEAEGKPDFEAMNALENLVTLCLPCHRTREAN